MAGYSPKVRRRRLGIQLRQLREDAGLTVEHVAERLEVSDSKISRIENGQVGATPRDVRDIATLYGVTGQRLENLKQLARETRVARETQEKPWWIEYSDLQPDFAAYEAEASTILMFAPMVLPGLLQTPDYACAILREIRYDVPQEGIERRAELRMKRQARLTEATPPEVWAVIDEAILHRMIGGPMTMHHQLKTLVETASLPNVTLQLLPYAAGAHAGLDGPFIVIRFPDPNDRDMIYFEHTDWEHYIDDPDAISKYLSIFNHLRAAAMKPEDSLRLLRSRAEELENE